MLEMVTTMTNFGVSFAIGLMKDSPYRLENAIRYLEEHGCHC